jgi:hypothetical protein
MIISIYVLAKFKPGFYGLPLVDIIMPKMNAKTCTKIRDRPLSKICLITAGDLNIGRAKRSIYCIKHRMLYQKNQYQYVIWLRD